MSDLAFCFCLKLAGGLGYDHTMFHYTVWGNAVVPHKRVERGDMYQQSFWFLKPVQRIGRVLLRWVVFKVNGGQRTLFVREQLVLVLLVRLARLKKNAIEVFVFYLVVGHRSNILPPRQSGTKVGIARRVAGPCNYDEIVRYLCQVVQVVSVYVPGKNA